jgi:hypothetical protein
MEKSDKNRTFAVPKEAPAPSGRAAGWTPEEIAQYIGFQLSELAGTNGHHEFEKLCFHLARKRIYPNLLPSTDPVSAGGDQGSDFETYEVTGDRPSPFFAKASEGTGAI